MILFRELVLSVQFSITIRLFDSFVLIRSLRPQRGYRAKKAKKSPKDKRCTESTQS